MSVVPLRNLPDDAMPNLSVNFEELLNKLDQDFAIAVPGLVEKFRFELDGLLFDVRRIKHETSHRFLITATIGYLPFTVESAERRAAVKAIIRTTHSLPTIHFTIDHVSKITAGGLFDVDRAVAPDLVFYPLVLFLQEARPFMTLIAQYLQPAAKAA